MVEHIFLSVPTDRRPQRHNYTRTFSGSGQIREESNALCWRHHRRRLASESPPGPCLHAE